MLGGTDKSAIGTLERTGHSYEDFYNTVSARRALKVLPWAVRDFEGA